MRTTPPRLASSFASAAPLASLRRTGAYAALTFALAVPLAIACSGADAPQGSEIITTPPLTPADDTPVDAGPDAPPPDPLDGSVEVNTWIITTTDLNLRPDPSTANPPLAVIPKGARLLLLETAPTTSFYHVEWTPAGKSPLRGWVSTKYVVPEDPTPAPIADAGPPVQGDPTAAELEALLATCTQTSSGLYAKDSGGSATIPICKLTGAVFFKADMDIDCDGKKTSVCNSSTDSSFQSQTAATDSLGKPLDAAALPFVVVPGVSSRWSYTAAGVALGNVAAVIYNGKVSYGIVGDVGPTSIVGEASYAMAKELGINPNPSTGGVSSGVSYIFFTGTAAKVTKNEDAVEARTLAIAKAKALLGR